MGTHGYKRHLIAIAIGCVLPFCLHSQPISFNVSMLDKKVFQGAIFLCVTNDSALITFQSDGIHQLQKSILVDSIEYISQVPDPSIGFLYIGALVGFIGSFYWYSPGGGGDGPLMELPVAQTTKFAFLGSVVGAAFGYGLAKLLFPVKFFDFEQLNHEVKVAVLKKYVSTPPSARLTSGSS